MRGCLAPCSQLPRQSSVLRSLVGKASRSIVRHPLRHVILQLSCAGQERNGYLLLRIEMQVVAIFGREIPRAYESLIV